MPDTNTPLTDAIHALTTYINDITRESDSDLSSAISHLVDGYGGVGEYRIDDIATRDNLIGDIVLNRATYIAPFSFANNTRITSISAPYVTKFTDKKDNTSGIGSYIFAGCTSLAEVNLPLLTNTGSGGYQFSGCTNLETIHLPCVSGTYMFNGCTKLRTCVLEGSGQLNGNGFRSCTSLVALDINTTRIYTNEFYGADKLNTIIIRTPSVCTLSNVNAFTNTPFASGKSGGTIYIPESLYNALGTGTNDYKSTANWSVVDGYGTITWAKIEGSQYQTHYADGTLISS